MKKIKEVFDRCKNDFWYYPKRAFCFALWIFTILSVFDGFLINQANAETGSITVTNTSQFSYTWSTGGIPAGAASVPFTVFFFANTSFQGLVNYTISDPSSQMGFTNQSNVTDFTIVTGGTGHGVASYSKSLNHITWVFSPDTVITSSNFTVSYTSNIFTEVAFNALVRYDNAVPDATKPICVVEVSDNKCLGGVVGTSYDNYAIGTESSATNFYNVTYPVSGYFRIDVSKIGQIIQTKDIIHSATSIYQTETTFNTNNFSFFGPQLDGIYLNVTLASNQGYADVLINSSGCPSCVAPTPSPTPTINPLTGSGIVWNKNNYTVNEIATISFVTDPSFFDFANTYRIDIIKNNVVLKSYNNLPISGSVQYQFSSVGTYTAKFIKTTLLLFETTLDEKSVQVTQTHASIFINSTVPIKTNTTATYDFGYIPVVPGITINLLDPNTGTLSLENEILLSTVRNGTQNVSFNQVGNYVVRLEDFQTGQILTETSVTTFFRPLPPSFNITNSTLLTDAASYGPYGIISVNYTVDNANFSNGVVYIDNFNVDMGIVTGELFSSGPFWGDTSLQANQITISLVDSPNRNVKWIYGNNRLRLMLVNQTTGTKQELAFKNWNYTTFTSTGYGLLISPSTNVSVGQQVQIKYTIPERNATLLIINSAGVNNVVRRTTVNQSGVSNVVFNKEDTYYISLLNPGGIEEIQVSIEVHKAGPTPTQPPTTGAQKASDIANLLDSNLFWALIFTVGLMIAVAIATKG